MIELLNKIDLSAQNGGGGGFTQNPMQNAKAFICSNNSNLTISDGIATGFGNLDFLQFPFLCKDAVWELNYCYQYSQIDVNQSLYGLNHGDVNNQDFVLWFDKNTGKVGLGINNNGTWHDEMSTDVVQNSDINTTWFYYKLAYNGLDTFTLSISTDGETYTKQFDYTCTLNCNGIINFGNDVVNSYNYVHGSVDLTHSNLKINGVTYNFV